MNFIRCLLIFFVMTETSAGGVAVTNRLLKFVWKLPPTTTIPIAKQRGYSLKLLTLLIDNTNNPTSSEKALKAVGDLVYRQKLDFYRQMSAETAETILERQYFDKLQTLEYYNNLSAMADQGMLTEEMLLIAIDGKSVADKAQRTLIESSGLDQYLRDSQAYLQRHLHQLEHIDSLTDQWQRGQDLANYLARLEQETFIKHLSLVVNDSKRSRHNLEKVIDHVYLSRLTDYETRKFFNLLRKSIPSTTSSKFALTQQAQNYLDSIDHHYLKTTGIPAIKLLKEINYPLPTPSSSKDILSITNRYIDKDKYSARRHLNGGINEIRVFAQR